MVIGWWRLQHAYGRATDTPGHLHMLEFGDAAARKAALEHLDVAVLHQGLPDTATAPAVRVVTTLLLEGRAHPDTVGSLLEFLGDAARSVTDLAGNDYFADDLPDLADAVAAAYPVVRPLLEASPPDRAAYRATHLVAIAQLPALADEREELAALLPECAGRDPGRQEPWVYCLGRLGVDVRDRLADPDPAVRLRAALIHEEDPRSRELIRAALTEPPPPGLHPSELVAAAIRSAADFDEIATAACELARRDSWTGFDGSCGALVRFAFPEPYGERRPLTGTQRALLEALVANDDQGRPLMLARALGASGLVAVRSRGSRSNPCQCTRIGLWSSSRGRWWKPIRTQSTGSVSVSPLT